MSDRRRLPDERPGVTHRFQIGQYKGYITVGLFDDGRPGEVFIRMSKEGATLAGLLDTIGILMSLSLQYGVPLKVITDKLSFTRFEPAGFTQTAGIEYATSPVDYIVRWMAKKFLPPEEKPEPVPPMASIPPEPASSDAILCDRCGHLMRRTGSSNCWVCPNCAASSGGCGG